MLGAALALPVAAQARRFPETDMLERAINAMGGRELLGRVKALHWLARIDAWNEQGKVDIVSRVRIEPFGTVRSESWFADKGPETSQTIVMAADGSGVNPPGGRPVVDWRQVAHERDIFGIYGYMMLIHARARSAEDGAPAPPGLEAIDRGVIVAEHDGFPPFAFTLDGDYRISQADYTVAAPEGGGTTALHLIYGGNQSDKGVTWPLSVIIFRDVAPYRTIAFTEFSVELS